MKTRNWILQPKQKNLAPPLTCQTITVFPSVGPLARVSKIVEVGVSSHAVVMLSLSSGVTTDIALTVNRLLEAAETASGGVDIVIRLRNELRAVLQEQRFQDVLPTGVIVGFDSDGTAHFVRIG